MGRLHLAAVAFAIAFGIWIATIWPQLAVAPRPWFLLAALLVLIGGKRWALVAPLVLFALGGGRAAWVNRDARAVENALMGQEQFRGSVIGAVDTTVSGARFSLELERGGRVLVIAKELSSNAIVSGDLLVIRGRVSFGERFRVEGASDRRHQLLAAGESAIVFTRAQDVTLVDYEYFGSNALDGLYRIANYMRTRARKAIDQRAGDRDGRGLVRALVTGDRSAVSPELATALRRAGISHLLAVSGLHLAVVGMFLFLVLRRLFAAVPAISGRVEPATLAALGALICALLYALMTGARPSALRAFVVIACVVGGLACFRRVRALDAIGAAAIVMLAWRPFLLFDPSFQMSFGAALVLALTTKPRVTSARSFWRRLIESMWILISVSSWALIATTPTALATFGEIAPLGVLVNVVAVPLVELVLLPLSLLGVMISIVGGQSVGFVLDAAIRIASAFADAALFVGARAPTIASAQLSGTQTVLAIVVIVILILAVRNPPARRLSRWWWLAVVFSSLLIASFQLSKRDPPLLLRVNFLDVGQGDATVIEFPNGRVWLVDTGGQMRYSRGNRSDPIGAGSAPGRLSILPFLRSNHIEKLDVVVISHAHPDHYLGLYGLLGTIPIDRLWLTTTTDGQSWPAELVELVAMAKRQGTLVEPPPHRVVVGTANVEVLAPLYWGAIAADPVSSVNDNSIALKVMFNQWSVLLAGDLEQEGEQLLLARFSSELNVDVAKVNHHGSATSSQVEWVHATSPRLAVISCGRDNRFGFPNATVLGHWQSVGAAIARTDRDGSVIVEFGKKLTAHRYNGVPIGLSSSPK